MLMTPENFYLRRIMPCLIVLLFFNCSNPESKGTSTEQHPNIIYILADDLGYGDVSANNPDSKIQTENIDRLASEGMRFTDAHSPSSVCTPTRYGILTGQYCWRSRLPQGVLRGYGRALLEKDQTTVASILKKKNYHTGVIGKWHLGLDWVVKDGHQQDAMAEGSQINSVGMVQEMNPEYLDFTKKPTDGPLDHGFDYSFILPASLDMDPYCYLENDVLVESPTAYTPGNDLETGYTEAFWRAGKMAPSFEFDQVLPTFRDKAIEFIEKNAPSDQPFFLYVPFAAPHTPWVPTAEFKGQTLAGTYGDFVKMVDDAVGRILAALHASGEEENTLVIFTSDNGPFWTPALIEAYDHRSAGPLRGMKADIWEGGHRIPYLVRWPSKVEAGSTTAAPTTLTHLLATVAELVGVQLGPGDGEDSYSILPLLLGSTDRIAKQKAIIHHSSRAVFAVRQGPWKLIEGRGSGGFSKPTKYEPKAGEAMGQLYNLEVDIGEKKNLYLELPEKVKEMQALLTEIRGG